MKASLERLKQLMKTASESDKIIREKFNANLHFIDNLCASREELELSIPSSSASTNSSTASALVVGELKQLLAETTRLKDTRQQLVKAANELLNDSSVPTAVRDLCEREQQPSVESLDRLFEAEYLKPLDAIKQQLLTIQSQQLKLIDSLKLQSIKFEELRRNDTTLKQRQMALQNLECGFQMFHTLNDHLEEGIQFYVDMTQELTNCKTECDDYCSARQLETEELSEQMARLNVASASQSGLGSGLNVSQQPNYYPPSVSTAWTPNMPLNYQQPPLQPYQYYPPQQQQQPYQQPQQFQQPYNYQPQQQVPQQPYAPVAPQQTQQTQNAYNPYFYPTQPPQPPPRQ